MTKTLAKRLFHAVFTLLAFYCCIALIHLMWFGNLGQINLWMVYLPIGAGGAVAAALGWTQLSKYGLSGAAAGLFIQYTVQIFMRTTTLVPGIWCNAAVTLLMLIVGIIIQILHHPARRQ